MDTRIPVTVLSGFLGAGKTSLLQHILEEGPARTAVIVNDMSEVNVDAAVIEQGGFRRREEELVELSNGCICCTLREDLLLEVQDLAEKGGIDRIVIESSGISEPVPVAQTFSYIDEELGVDVTSSCRLDTMVTVVDAYRFWNDYGSGDTLLDRRQGLDAEDERSIVDLLVDQIEFCDVLILNKTDLVPESACQKLRSFLQKLQPEADIIDAAYGRVPLDKVLNTGKFSFDKASMSAGWIKELEAEEHIPETEEYGISSFVYRRRTPFDSRKLEAWFEEIPSSIARAKGITWLSEYPDLAFLLSQAGTSGSLNAVAQWAASLEEDAQQELMQEDPDLQRELDRHPEGDRKTEIVFIGVDMDEKAICRSLDHCLTTIERSRSHGKEIKSR